MTERVKEHGSQPKDTLTKARTRETLKYIMRGAGYKPH